MDISKLAFGVLYRLQWEDSCVVLYPEKNDSKDMAPIFRLCGLRQILFFQKSSFLCLVWFLLKDAAFMLWTARRDLMVRDAVLCGLLLFIFLVFKTPFVYLVYFSM